MSTDGMDASTPGDRSEEPESLAQLRGDCARMSSRWHRREAASPSGFSPTHDRPAALPGEEAAGEPARPHGVRVPERAARLLDGMSDYGD